MTANELILGALKESGIVSVDQAAVPYDMQQWSLDSLNRMLKAWAAERLLVSTTTEDTKTLTASDGTYTWGTGGDITTARPSRIVRAIIRWSDDTETAVDVIGQEQWADLGDKTSTGTPTKLTFWRGQALDTIKLWPLPDVSTYTLVLYSTKPVGSLSAMADTVDCTSEMEDALHYNLATRLRVSYGGPVSQDLAGIAVQSKNRVRQLAAIETIKPHYWGEHQDIYAG